MSERGPTRRAALVMALGLTAMAGVACRPFGEPAAPRPDEVTRERVLAGKRALLDRYAATVARHPDLGRLLDPLTTNHRAHVRALNGNPTPTATATPTASPSPGATTPTATPAVAGTTGAALAALAAAEDATAEARAGDVLGASPRLARILASIGGCEAAHAELLRASAPRSRT